MDVGSFLFSIASGSLQRVFISAENNRKYYKDCEEIRVEEIRNDIYARESAEAGGNKQLGAVRDNALSYAGAGIEQ